MRAWRAPLSLPLDIEARLRELVRLLDGLRQDLLDEAEGQEWCDANLNAAAFRTSAEHVSRSRACLEHGLAGAGK